MKILAIDTSCDDTCIAIIEIKHSKIKILSNIVSSQIKIHQEYGGVFPTLAKRAHQRNLVLVLKTALKKAGLLKIKQQTNVNEKRIKKFLIREQELFKKTKYFLENYQVPKIDLIAITQGPGLEPCLWTGINFAKTLSFFWKKPIIAVNHLEGHIFANFLSNPQLSNFKFQNFPAVALIASGGHTELILIKKIGKYKVLGETLDDAAGECLDKIAKMIGLLYPGGPEIENLAKKGNPKKYQLPRPMLTNKNYDFSFSGLKTAVLYLIKKLGPGKVKQNRVKINIAASSQQAVIEVLVQKTIKSAKENKTKTIILGGGVTANTALKKYFYSKIKKENLKIKLVYPQKKLSTDNAAMVAIGGYFNRDKKISPENLQKLKAKSNLNF